MRSKAKPVPQAPEHNRSKRATRVRRVLRLVAANVLLAVAGVSAVGVVAEIYFRLSSPFVGSSAPWRFVPNVGPLRRPNTEVRHTDNLDYWTVSRSNSLGFVDREPPDAERARTSCHVAILGDSMVEARHVPIADKLQVRLEERAAAELPHLDVTTSAFGFGGTGQVAQLAYYDHYARALSPNLLVLVFVPNDLADNSPILNALDVGVDPAHPRFLAAEPRADGTIGLRLPDANWREHRLPQSPTLRQVRQQLTRMSALASWMDANLALRSQYANPQIDVWVRLLRERPGYEALHQWLPATRIDYTLFAEDTLPPVYDAALPFTAFAMAQFRERAQRDGVPLAILATHRIKVLGNGLFDRLNAMAHAQRIPVIDQYAHIVRQGALPSRDAQWPHDPHWNAAGHRWAAGALLEYLRDNQDVCEDIETRTLAR